MSNTMTWLENIKAGDRITIKSHRGFSGYGYVDRLVTRTTKTLIIDEKDNRWVIRTGRKQGGSSFQQLVNMSYPEVQAQRSQHEAAEYLERIRHALRTRVNEICTDDLATISHIEAIYEVVKNVSTELRGKRQGKST